jgi:hypothetical protein
MRQNIRKLYYPFTFVAALMLFWWLGLFAQHGVGAASLDHTSLQPYPIRNDAVSIKEAYAQVERWNGRAVSIEATVKSVVANARGQPRLELAVDGGSDTSIWAIWALTDTKGMSTFLTPGEKLRVFGWIVDSVLWTKGLQLDLPRQNPMLLLSACLVKVRGLDAVFDSKSSQYCEAWRSGYMPPDMDMGR